MDIDVSAWKAWWTCPQKYWWRYIRNLEPKREPGPLEFGTRMHQLLANRLRMNAGMPLEPDEPLPEALEAEAQRMFAAYAAQWGEEFWDVLDVERTFRLPIPATFNQHHLIGKIDARVCYTSGPYEGLTAILEHKTEARNSPANDPQAWIARMQKSLYVWASQQVYGEKPAHVILDVLTRQSEKGQQPPTFRTDILETDDQQITQALNDIIYVADRIHEIQHGGYCPRNTESCMRFRYKCEFYNLCHLGATEENLSRFQEAKPYLEI